MISAYFLGQEKEGPTTKHDGKRSGSARLLSDRQSPPGLVRGVCLVRVPEARPQAKREPSWLVHKQETLSRKTSVTFELAAPDRRRFGAWETEAQLAWGSFGRGHGGARRRRLGSNRMELVTLHGLIIVPISLGHVSGVAKRNGFVERPRAVLPYDLCVSSMVKACQSLQRMHISLSVPVRLNIGLHGHPMTSLLPRFSGRNHVPFNCFG